MDVLEPADGQVLLVPMDRPPVGIQHHVCGRNVVAQYVAPLMNHLCAALWLTPRTNRHPNFVFEGVEYIGALLKEVPDPMDLEKLAKPCP